MIDQTIERAGRRTTHQSDEQMIDQMIDSQLKQDGAHEVTAGHRLLEVDGLTYLRPTVVRAEDPSHSLADSEFLFPFASVVELPQEELLELMSALEIAPAAFDLATSCAKPVMARLAAKCSNVDPESVELLVNWRIAGRTLPCMAYVNKPTALLCLRRVLC